MYLEYTESAESVKAIRAQQASLQKGEAAFCIGEQLADICQREPASAELVRQDLENEEMSLKACAAKLQATADEKHRKDNSEMVCIMPTEAETVIRAFYGLPEAGSIQAETTACVNLLDFL